MSSAKVSGSPATKVCSVCGIEKPRDSFGKKYDKKYPEKRRSYCKTCANKRKSPAERKRRAEKASAVKKPKSTRPNSSQELFFEETADGVSIEKYCSTCGRRKTIEHFSPNISTSTGYHSMCKSCKAKSMSRNRKEKDVRASRSLAFDRMVMKWGGGSCSVCGESRDVPAMYAWHHLDPTKKEHNLSQLRHVAISSISQEAFEKNVKRYLDEVSKCAFVCHNCHAIIHHYQRQQKDVPDEFKRFLPEAA